MHTVYLETSVVSYLAARPSRDLIVAAHQQSTWNWWAKQRKNFEVVVSPMVWDEARQGNPVIVKRRQEYLNGLKVLNYCDDVVRLAKAYNHVLRLPAKKAADAIHLAYASWYGVDYLLT